MVIHTLLPSRHPFSVDGVFSFLLRTMHCDDLNNRLVIVENSGGILRNISAVAAAREEYR